MKYGRVKELSLNLADLNADEAPEFTSRIPGLVREAELAIWNAYCSKCMSGVPYGITRPKDIGKDPADTKKIDLKPEAASCIPYYVASHLIQYDDPSRASSLLTEFETRVSRLRLPLSAEHKEIENVYTED